MKYVSAITLEGEEAVSHYSMDTLDSLCVTVCDTEEVGARDFSGEELSNLQIVGLSWNSDCLVVVRHSKKEVLLHKYIACASTVYGGYDVVDGESDFVRFDIGCVDVSGVVGHKDLVIDTDLQVIELCGLHGSVALTTLGDSDYRQVSTLYDTLCQVCSITGLNIMRYNQVIFYSIIHRYKTMISFARSSEAMTFFTKMYSMDGVKDAIHC